MTDTRRRVKLYALNAERQWDDKGTGHVSSNYVERLKGISLLVRAEADGSLLLESKIQHDTAYQKQQETLIVWSEGENYDLALSFQEKAGCDEIWEKICQVQGKDPSVDFTQDIVEESEDERCFDEISDSVPAIDLPPCEIGKLEEISELVSSCLPSPIRREKLAVAIENEGYIKKLLGLFHMCEDLENNEGLHHLYEIFKNIFLLNKNALFELMFAEDTIFDVVGCLEFDPNLSTPKRHREYLKKIASFHEVIKINNPELLSKIHQTYRVQYIQEVVLPTPSVFEENMLSTLSSFIFFNKNEIVTQLQDDEKFLTELFNQLTDEDTEETRRKELVLFLKEFFSFSTTLQPQARESFFKTLNNLGVLQAMEITLASENKLTKAASIDILRFIVDFSPSMVREYMLQQLSNTDDDTLLMNVVIEQMTCDSDPDMGGAVQLMYIIKDLLDPENMLGAVNKQEKTDFLNYFYKHCMHVLIGPLLANTVNDTPEREDSCSVQLLSLILELLTFCVEHHTYHIKNYILHKDLLRRILVLMKSRHTFLVLGALRFMRKIVALKDEFYNRYIIKGNLFAPVIDALVKNNGRYNMMDSAICEMFEHIRSEDIKSLSTHVVENFGQTVDKVLYVNTFKALRQKYEQQQDRLRTDRSQAPLENVGSILRQGRFRRDPRQLEEEEEMWFNEDDYGDDDSPTSASATSASASSGGSPVGGAVSAAAVANNSSPNVTTNTAVVSPSPDGTLSSETPLAAAAAVAAAAGTAVGFVTASNLTSSQHQQCSSITSTGLAAGDISAKNAAAVFSEINTVKANDKGTEGKVSPNHLKKSLVDYDADSDEEDTDEESKSPKKSEENTTEVEKQTTTAPIVPEIKDNQHDQEYMEEEKQTDENNAQSADDVAANTNPVKSGNEQEDISQTSGGILRENENSSSTTNEEETTNNKNITESTEKSSEEKMEESSQSPTLLSSSSPSSKTAISGSVVRKEMDQDQDDDDDEQLEPAAKRLRTSEEDNNSEETTT